MIKDKKGYEKSTGYVRRFDDLGRIVIPRELRKKLFEEPKEWGMGIGEGEQMEIFLEDDMVILKKYKGE